MTSDEALGILYSKADTTNEGWECRQIVQKEEVNSMSSELTPERLTCPHCGSNNVQYMYCITALSTNGNRNKITSHYLCKDCHKEFDV